MSLFNNALASVLDKAGHLTDRFVNGNREFSQEAKKTAGQAALILKVIAVASAILAASALHSTCFDLTLPNLLVTTFFTTLMHDTWTISCNISNNPKIASGLLTAFYIDKQAVAVELIKKKSVEIVKGTWVAHHINSYLLSQCE
jgi:hypothetical protein